MGRQGFDRWCRGRIHVLGRPGGRIRCPDPDGGTSNRSGDIPNQVLHPLLCGRTPVLCLFVSETGKHGVVQGGCDNFAQEISIRDNLHHRHPLSSHLLPESSVPFVYFAGLYKRWIFFILLEYRVARSAFTGSPCIPPQKRSQSANVRSSSLGRFIA